MEQLCVMNDHISAFFLVFPLHAIHNSSGRAVDYLPPAPNIIPGIDLHQLFGNAFHQRNFQRFINRRIKSRHDIALLHLIRIFLRPFIVFSGRIIGRINLCTGFNQLLGKFCSITIPDRICAPSFHQFYRFRHDVQICRNRHSPCPLPHRSSSSSKIISSAFCVYVPPSIFFRTNGIPFRT